MKDGRVGFGRDARNNPPEAGAADSFRARQVIHDHESNSVTRRRERHPRHQAAGGHSERLGMAVVDARRTGRGGVVVRALEMVAEAQGKIPVVPPVPAHVRAKEMLEKALALIAHPKPFCTLVSDTVRTYLEERFDFHAPERTTEEFLHELRGTNLLSAEQKEKLGEFLGCCDLVKFAKYEPGETGVARPAWLGRAVGGRNGAGHEVQSPESTVQSHNRYPHDFCASIFSFVVAAAAAAGVAEGPARPAAGVSLFVGATGGRIDEGAAFARRRISGGAALAGAGGVRCRAGAAALDEKRRPKSRPAALTLCARSICRAA